MKYVHRLVEEKLLKMLGQFPALAVTGPRQSGKSTLLKEALKGKYKYITFDDLVLRERCKNDPKLFLEQAGDYVILDEIQHVPEILSYIKMSIDAKRHKNGRFVITGSQQFNLIKNLGDSLAGRICLFELLPFSEEEIYSKKKTVTGKTARFYNACLKGAFPELVVKPKLNRDEWYSSYLQSYLERDVRGLYGVGSLLDFQRFMRLLAGRCSQLLNLSSMANDLGVAVTTIKSWLSILSASQIIYLLPPYYKNFGKRVSKNPKAYFTDCGLAAYLTGMKTRDLILFGPLAGALFENYVIQEILKISYAMGRRPELYYYRTHKGLEVDLLIASGGKLIPFEIKMSKTPSKNMAAGIEKIRALSAEIDQSAGGIICLGGDSFKITRGVEVYSPQSILEKVKEL